MKIWVGRFVGIDDDARPSLTLTGPDRALLEISLRIMHADFEGKTPVQIDYKNTKLIEASPEELCAVIAGGATLLPSSSRTFRRRAAGFP